MRHTLTDIPVVHAFTRRAKRDEGQAAFEFLLIVPGLIIFILLLVDFGMLMYGYVSVSNATREGARFASVNCGAGACTTSAVQTRVIDRSGGFLSDVNDVDVNWLGTGASQRRGDPVQVRVDYPHNFLFFPAVTVPIQSCSTMRLERNDATAPAGASAC